MLKRMICTAMTLLLFSASAMAMPPCGDKIYQGMDVSVWQRSIDWAKVRAAGVQVAYIRASEGSRVEDAYFRQHYEGAKAQGIRVGFYHYMTARNVTEAENQAEFFARVIRGTRPDCRLALDYEATGDMTSEEINACALAFLKRLEEVTGWEACLYADAWAAREIFSKEEQLASYPLWIADWGVQTPQDTPLWRCWAGWQYTDNGRIPGVGGRVDLDRFNQGIFLKRDSGLSPAPTPCPTIPLPEC